MCVCVCVCVCVCGTMGKRRSQGAAVWGRGNVVVVTGVGFTEVTLE